ncbi:Lactobacillus shifted protein [Erysiphe neolycopersici]|uniref:Lactobacillus shifted protein n=1 Tax=Erysiphe neolycopersici TaxID=212602 RepID=A0A420HCX0_9PEZI|nr:Lactobacillus shifted protein [Erysiphe neolycopersici]
MSEYVTDENRAMLRTARGSFVRSLNFRTQIKAKCTYAFWASQRLRSSEPSNLENTTANHKSDGLPLNLQQNDVQIGKAIVDENNTSIVPQAPNRIDVWSRSQNPRSKAMSGPRFEQTLFEFQPAPQAAIELSSKQLVRWSHERSVSCDGGGGPLGHPRVFINIDKPQICVCGYCGRPFAHEHHRKQIEALHDTPFPLA